ncbi:hypothetical protein BDZ89DRAFT_1055993 [Hymenopellis radicata]|nr:hypothetical protein BDZ89DRAFT_1055993 [Hymenopellis radicata]
MAVDISEVAQPRSHRRLDFYFVLVFMVAPVWFIVPACWAFGRTLYSIALFEVFFNVYYMYLARCLAGPSTSPIRAIEDIETTLTRVLKAGLADLSSNDVYDEETLENSRPSSPEETVIQLDPDDPRAATFATRSGRFWFNGAPWSEVRKHEVRQWLHWALFNTDMPPLETMKPDHRAALERAVTQMEKRIGRPIPEGSAPHLKPLRLSLDKFNTRLQRKYHLKFATFNGLEYCIHIPDSWDSNSNTRPIVFFHGLGLGISQYKIALTRIIRNFSDRPLLVVLQPHISQNIFHPNFLKPMTREQTTERLAALLDQLGWANMERDTSKETSKQRIAAQKGVTMLSHSNGTYGHAWMLKDYPHMVTRSCFVDPVTFCSWEGDTCYNFLYRRCTTGIDLIMRYFVSTELGVANLMQRQFDWHSNALWYEEIPNARDVTKTLFVLGGKDSIVKAQRVKQYLMSHGVRNGLYWDENGRHGQPFVLNGESHNKILTWLRQS